jgi:ABC-type multidrug transport system fused ATPase/permease subunit
MIKGFKQKEIYRAFNLLSKSDRRRLGALTLTQFLLSFLDLIGIFSMGLLITMTMGGGSEGKASEWFDLLADLLGISSQSESRQLQIVAILSVSLLITKTLFSIIFTRKILTFFSVFGANLSGRLNRDLLDSKFITLEKYSTQEIVYSSTRGVEVITLDILANLIVVIADVFFLAIIAVGLFLVDPLTALSVIALFLSIGFIMFFSLQNYSLRLGKEVTKLNLESNEKILEAFSSRRENFVKNNQSFYAQKILHIRRSLAKTMAGIYFIPYLSKYVIEITIILGSLSYAALQYFIGDSNNFTQTYAVFLVAATRAAPSALRVQQGLLQMKSAIGKSGDTLDLIYKFSIHEATPDIQPLTEKGKGGFTPGIHVENLSFRYPSQESDSLKNLNLIIKPGTTVAIVGPSGAGKSTLVDCILGILEPREGKVLVSGQRPEVAISRWPGMIGYVPQDTYIINASLKENIIIGYGVHQEPQHSVVDAIEKASLTSFVASLPNGVDTILGERGSRLSGGQKQRVGIARAIYSNPGLLVLDEATSALDQTTEGEISNSLLSLKEGRTIVIVAHRMATILGADLIVYLENGYIRASGTITEVANAIPDFRTSLLGDSGTFLAEVPKD